MQGRRTIRRYIVDVEDQVIRTKYTSMEQAISIKEQTHPFSWKSPHIEHGYGN